MDSDSSFYLTTRREVLRHATTLASGAFFAQLFPPSLHGAPTSRYAQQPSAPPTDPAAAFRAQMAAIPIQTQKLADNLTLLSGPGGNVVVLNGADGKFIVDTFVSPAWLKLKEALDGLGNAPLNLVIDTHWHFDHTDNNAALHALGATVLAHENTKQRMSEPHDLQVLGLHFPPSPGDALPQQTFKISHKLQANSETLALEHVPPAHTDTDIYIHFQKANIIQTGDLFFNGFYPYIDGSTGGALSGMIAAADKILPLANNYTKIVPGHGPLGNKADLAKFRDMLVTARDRVQKLKAAGKSAQEAVAAKPFADLEPVWGKGFFNGDVFVQIAYLTL
ncbi:MAG TPA: MBL fold metallo-hydrolase [Candidatus Acidoferrum sp.]|jgi:glyoxylase-like metal-dependent hydrolase (beta-lactamase superfamily II)|nr:MBL fold metallo-hydrolase [Candidatus Acidoferrum sp.]